MIKKEDFFKKEYLLEMVATCEGLTDIVEKEKHIEAYDEKEDMMLNFHHTIDLENLFDFGSLKVDKERFFKIIKENLDDLLFLMPNKIYFISNEEELDRLLCEYELQSLDYNNVLGTTWLYDSVIVINVNQCKVVSKDISKTSIESFSNTFNEVIWTTLIHELRHITCDLGLVIPDYIIPLSEGEEDNVERYCNSCFFDNIYYCDYKCFDIDELNNKN